jgi:hypothetical protein
MPDQPGAAAQYLWHSDCVIADVTTIKQGSIQ